MEIIPNVEDISPKANIIARLEIELAYYDITVQHVSHYTMETPPFCTSVKIISSENKVYYYFLFFRGSHFVS